MTETELIGLELEGWRALSTTAQEARSFYGRVLDDHVVMVLPDGMLLDDREEILDSMSGRPWASFALEEPATRLASSDVAMLAYGVVAQRPDTTAYSALVSSTYIRRHDGWKLALHQHTPR